MSIRTPIAKQVARPITGSWASPDAALYFDFRNRIAEKRGEAVDFNSLITASRASSKWPTKSDGSVIEVSSNVAALTDQGLDVEASATNLALRSNEFDADPFIWTLSNDANPATTVAGASGISPDGTNNAWLLTPGVSGNTPSVQSANANRMFQQIATTNGEFTNSIWIKKHLLDSDVGIFINNNSSDTVKASNIVAATDDWQRIDATGTTDGGTTGQRIVIAAENPVLIWQAQAETGPVATSPIITTGSSATRSHDRIVTDISDIDFSQGTIIDDVNIRNWGSQGWSRFLEIGDTSPNRINIERDNLNDGFNFTVRKDGVAVGTIAIGNILPGKHKAAISWDGSSADAYLDGVHVGEVILASAYEPYDFTELRFGCDDQGNRQPNYIHETRQVFDYQLADARLLELSS